VILVDVIYTCDGRGCHETVVVEHGGLTVGERAPAIQMPAGWNGVDTGATICPRCAAEPVPPVECDGTTNCGATAHK